ncbi:hypothetical protein DL766_005788 [Monosporascus sp. MC13-8B]|uniref:Uncharacterized protein n=1 Tax=Monosporascus cannonballus TaxID=155416 RepID=A0ABY0HJ55_9PEZI|nr:hypothetical protein DL762_001999 [Monosporascus cannonballus]RYO97123.1 hypothetical protein DL763_002913 [Monosporascus cannonballus]RYP28635.1 hypothetical protein DL766_005788 [Monosporascus sp. MC13-8B]
MPNSEALQDTIPVFSVLVDTLDVAALTEPTRAPVGQPTSYPFRDWSVEDVAKFAKEHFDQARQGIVPGHLVILGEQTMDDRTCLLVTLKEGREAGGELLIVRADFQSSLVLLNVKVMGVGGDRHFETVDADGVIRLGRAT